jgi:trk system potassium uptake protein
MKYIIIGLGNFGASLAEKLTAQGNEVIGIDTRMSRVEQYKEIISHTICLDATDEYTVSGLPLKETDVVIIAIGEDQSSNILATALFKNLHVKRLISRAINDLHEKVLQAIGVDEIVHPEEESAEHWANKLGFENVVDSFEVSDDYSIVEIAVPAHMVGVAVQDVDFRKNHNLVLLTTIRNTEVRSIIGKPRIKRIVEGVASSEKILEAHDILVLYGCNTDINRFLRSNARRK